MKPRTGLAALLVTTVFAVAWAAPSDAVDLSGLGGRAGIAMPVGYGAAPAFGMQAEFEIPDSEFRLVPALHVWESHGVTDVNPSFDVHFAMRSTLPFDPYMGAGLSVHFINDKRTQSVSRDAGGSLFSGLAFPVGDHRFYFEGRYTIADLSQLAVVTGFTWRLP